MLVFLLRHVTHKKEIPISQFVLVLAGHRWASSHTISREKSNLGLPTILITARLHLACQHPSPRHWSVISLLCTSTDIPIISSIQKAVIYRRGYGNVLNPGHAVACRCLISIPPRDFSQGIRPYMGPVYIARTPVPQQAHPTYKESERP